MDRSVIPLEDPQGSEAMGRVFDERRDAGRVSMSLTVENYLGFDFGLKKTGVAIGQRITGRARALGSVRSDNADFFWRELDRLVMEWQPTGFVVGLPVPLDVPQEPNPLIAQIEAFCRNLEEHFLRPVYVMDECLSTREAESIFRSQTKKAGRRFADVKDEMAAQLILQSWLDTTSEGVSSRA